MHNIHAFYKYNTYTDSLIWAQLTPPRGRAAQRSFMQSSMHIPLPLWIYYLKDSDITSFYYLKDNHVHWLQNLYQDLRKWYFHRNSTFHNLWMTESEVVIKPQRRVIIHVAGGRAFKYVYTALPNNRCRFSLHALSSLAYRSDGHIFPHTFMLFLVWQRYEKFRYHFIFLFFSTGIFLDLQSTLISHEKNSEFSIELWHVL